MKRQRLSGKEVKALNERISGQYGLAEFFNKQDNIELVEGKYVMANGEIMFFLRHDLLIPSLKLVLKRNFLKVVVIDMPAVKYIADGADVMRPGIKEVERFAKDDIVAVVDEKNRKPLAVGKALFSSEEIKAMERGKVILNLHHVGDDIWLGTLRKTGD
jgi:PUA domain protein